ncbi:MAG: hypothetical protein ACREXR_05015 [Gammaproteobacteria bacterium]
MRKGIIASLSISALFAGAVFSFFIFSGEEQTALAQTSCVAGSKKFTVFYSHWKRVRNHPNFEAAGLVEVPGAYEGNFLNKGCKWSGDGCSLNEKRLHHRLQKIAAEEGNSFAGLIHVDVESVGLDTKSKVARNFPIFSKIAAIIRKELPQAKFAFYGTAGPGIINHDRLYAGDQELIQQAMDKGDLVAPVLQLADATNPQAYTFDDVKAKWAKLAKFDIDESHRLAPGKPVYVVLKVVYNIHNPKFAWKPLPYDYVKFQLETLLASGADGAIFWEGATRKWGGKKEGTQFWPAVLDFMKQNKLCITG